LRAVSRPLSCTVLHRSAWPLGYALGYGKVPRRLSGILLAPFFGSCPALERLL
jgi:hypothetical protein